MNTENPGLSKCSSSFAISLAIAGIVNGLLVIAKEKSPAVMSGMKNLTGHHWITHSAIVIALFVIVGWVLNRTNAGQGPKLSVCSLVRTLVFGVVLSSLIIVGFYLVAD